ncbi:hypothetical protein Leryth_026478 [Lithospermum erythrorhizon]|nr:hypothetical protein Leryth_026478 [Lithospermum erythrorhizon]
MIMMTATLSIFEQKNLLLRMAHLLREIYYLLIRL